MLANAAGWDFGVCNQKWLQFDVKGGSEIDYRFESESLLRALKDLDKPKIRANLA